MCVRVLCCGWVGVCVCVHVVLCVCCVVCVVLCVYVCVCVCVCVCGAGVCDIHFSGIGKLNIFEFII